MRLRLSPVLLVAAAVLACGPAEKPAARAENVILVSLDTLRADRLGCYGYGRDVSPFLDLVADESVVFERAYSPSSYTLPAHASIFLSQYVSGHGVLRKKDRIPQEATTLAEVLRAEGFRTLGAYSGPYMHSDYGFDQGFEKYRLAARKGGKADAAKVNRLASAWLTDIEDDERFFLFLHYFDVHDPFIESHPVRGSQAREGFERFDSVDPTKGLRREKDLRNVAASRRDPDKPALGNFLSDEEKSFISERYDDGVAYLDYHLGELFRELQLRGLLENTLVVVTSDHGEMLFDHEEIVGHGRYLHESLIRVPLLIRLPGATARGRVTAPVSTIDIFPTVLAALGIDHDLDLQGRTLDLHRADRIKGRPLLSEVDNAVAVIDGEWKLYEDPGRGWSRVYDLGEEPRETRSSSDAEVERRLGDELARLREESSRWRIESDEIELDPELQRELEALGYVD